MCVERGNFSFVIIDRLLTYGDTSERFLCHKIENHRVNWDSSCNVMDDVKAVSENFFANQYPAIKEMFINIPS